jgi:hypothetical protein
MRPADEEDATVTWATRVRTHDWTQRPMAHRAKTQL